jgi:hypothetical protein
MILVNFEFNIDRVGVTIGGTYHDLHNNYDFIEATDSKSNLSLLWRRTKGSWVPKEEPESILIMLERVSFLEQRGVPSHEFMEYGFFPNNIGSVEYNGALEQKPGHETLVIRFENGSEIAVRAESATASVSNGA